VAESAALRRRLTIELRRRRAEAKLTQRQVAQSLDWSPSKVIRIEQGTVRIGVTDLQALLRLYGVSDPEMIAELTAMARESKKLPFAEYREIFAAEALRYFQYEANASIIRQVTPLLVPGLLQLHCGNQPGEPGADDDHLHRYSFRSDANRGGRFSAKASTPSR